MSRHLSVKSTPSLPSSLGSLFSRGITWQEHKTAGGDMLATQVFKMGVVKVVSYQDNRRKGARVEEADIIASNGVIHAIDTVI